MHVVHDLLAHVHRRAVLLQRPLDRLDRPVDAGAVAAGLGQQDALARLRSCPQPTDAGTGGRSTRRARTHAARADCARLPGREQWRMNPLPLPLRIAAGLVATAVEQARELPRLMRRVPGHRDQPGAAGVDADAAEGDRAGDQGRPRAGRAAPGRGDARPGPPSTTRSRPSATATSTVTTLRPPSSRPAPRRRPGASAAQPPRRPPRTAPTTRPPTDVAAAPPRRPRMPEPPADDRRPAARTRPARTRCPATGR